MYSSKIIIYAVFSKFKISLAKFAIIKLNYS